jgi:DNA-directed RNA polymerase specialized sigma24 family protein
MIEKDLDRLFDEHAESLLKFLILRTGDRALAEDVVADTFERALRKRSLFDRARGTEKAWLYTIATNLLRDGARRREVEERAYASAFVTEPALVGADGGLARFEARVTVMEADGGAERRGARGGGAALRRRPHGARDGQGPR